MRTVCTFRTSGGQAEKKRQKDLAHAKSLYKEVIDPKTNRKYWFNQETMETTWEDPFKKFKKKKR